jgi:hypothetical protein
LREVALGICLKDVELLIRLRKAGNLPDRASVIEIGAQQVSNSVLRSRRQVEELGRLFRVATQAPLPGPLPSGGVSDGYEPMSSEAPPARDLWTWLGFSYASIDIDGSLGSIPLDLNSAEVPKTLRGKYDLVTNFGTTEHVANQVNAFKVVHDLTALNGVMMHTLPAQGALNHGLLNYNPKFFWALAKANDYGWLYFDFVPEPTSHGLPDNLIEAVRPYRPAVIQSALEYQVTDCAMWVVLQKRKARTFSPPMDGPG